MLYQTRQLTRVAIPFTQEMFRLFLHTQDFFAACHQNISFKVQFLAPSPPLLHQQSLQDFTQFPLDHN